jgi:uncharacterized repeat protein (TIGR01451 family)
MNKWTLGGGLAVAALLAAFSIFSSSANAGLDGFDDADIDCDKIVSGSEVATDGVVELGDPIAFDVICQIVEVASKGTAPIIVDNVTIIDTLPDNFDIDNVTCIQRVDGVTSGAIGEINGQNVVCVFVNGTPPFNVGDTFTLEVEGSFDSGACGDIKNEARGEFGGDVDIAVEFIFLECEDISVDKTAVTLTDATGATVAQGGTIVYTVEVCNSAVGFGEAQQVFFADLLPLGSEFQSAASADFDITVEGSLVTGVRDSLQPGNCATAVITVDTADDAPCGFTFTNRVTAGSSQITSDIVFNESNFIAEFDGDTSNNSDQTVTTVACPTGQPGGQPSQPGGGGGGGQPAVGTGDSAPAEEAIAGWQLGLLSLLVVGSLSGAYFAYRQAR